MRTPHSHLPHHQVALPIHYNVYLRDVGCKRASASPVESVFSGTGKFVEEGRSAGETLIGSMARAHENWKIEILRPTIKEIVDSYNRKFHPSAVDEVTGGETGQAGPSGVAPV